jgi:hypothetical protein
MMLALSEGWYAESEDEIEHMLASFPFPNGSVSYPTKEG